jgi:hypothetical protein
LAFKVIFHLSFARMAERRRLSTAHGHRQPRVALINFAMSAYGTKRTSMLTLSMSAFRGKADIPISLANVR